MNDGSEGEILLVLVLWITESEDAMYLHIMNSAKQSKQLRGNLGDELTPTFDKVMRAQAAVMDYQQGSCFRIWQKTYLMNLNTDSDR